VAIGRHFFPHAGVHFARAIAQLAREGHDLGDINRFSFYEMTKTIIAAPPDVHRVNEKHRPE